MKTEKKYLMMDACQGIGIGIFVGWICYRSWMACVFGILGVPFYILYKIKKRKKERQMTLWREFKDATAMMYSSTAAGGTLEKALKDTRHDMKHSDTNYQVLIPEFDRMCLQLEQNQSLDAVLTSFAERSKDEDIAYFVRILIVARKSGGSLADIIRHTADTMNLRMEMNEEIETLLAGKRGEWKVMLVVPPGILLYMNICSAEYMNILYTNPMGRVLMTFALVIYGAAILIGNKILNIRV